MGILEIITGEATKVVVDRLLHKFLISIKIRKNYNKHNLHILFIDDEEFPIVENLKDAGWSVEKIDDLKNIEDDSVLRSQIIFVDYKKVGRFLSKKEEGIGIIKALKGKYKKSKRVILYSGHNRFTLGHDIKAADNFLPKNADSYEFIQMIEAEMLKIR